MKKNITFRVDSEEKQTYLEQAKEKGFDALSAYIRYLIRKDA